MMSELYPFRFQPLLRRYLWGGRKLGTVLGKPIGPEDDYAESWEVVDHGPDQSVVLFGPLAGVSLGELVRRCGRELLGRHHPQPRFPLLLKFLDAHRTLSVQVHPNDQQAARLDPPELGKSEAWVVLEAEPEGVIYAGLKPGVDRQMLAEAVREGRCETLLHLIRPQAGDCVLVAEIQQASDTTFRLFDWNRLGPDGKPRPLHVEQALEVIDFERGPVQPQRPKPAELPGRERLVECERALEARRARSGRRRRPLPHSFRHRRQHSARRRSGRHPADTRPDGAVARQRRPLGGRSPAAGRGAGRFPAMSRAAAGYEPW